MSLHSPLLCFLCRVADHAPHALAMLQLLLLTVYLLGMRDITLNLFWPLPGDFLS